MKDRNAPSSIAVVLYEGVEPIDIGGTVGVISMARRIVPNVTDAVVAAEAGPVRLAGGLVVEAQYGFADAPDCDMTIVLGGPGWPAAAKSEAMKRYLRSRSTERLASVCTGAMILAEAGSLRGHKATTRRSRAGAETIAPLDLLGEQNGDVSPLQALVVDDGVITGGGVSLAIDLTLYVLGKFYGEEVRGEIARMIEYDRAFEANERALGIVRAN